ncbi:hypothetical protein [Acinetobacter baumannii]|uniref:hypothetical protein n=1 Tax=Acinetobacter baumannii TaxID=470 RepID=UPI003AF588E0
MDKCREEFEAIAIQNCWNINKYPAGWDGHGDDEYADDFVSGAWWAFQHQQAKVEELQKRVDAVEQVITKIRNGNYASDQGRYVAIFIGQMLEQALKGEG